MPKARERQVRVRDITERKPREAALQELNQTALCETILAVEAHPDVRAFTVETVCELGYDVLEARDRSMH